MLKKLFRHDFYAILRYWWIIIASQVGLSAVAALVLKLVVDTFEAEAGGFLRVCMILFVCMSAFFIMLAPLVTSLLCYVRFYKNLYTDEGYLTFTLPVKRKTVLLSKLLTTALFNLMDILVLFACVLSILLVGFSGTDPSFAALLGQAFQSLFESFGAGWIVVVLSVLVLLLAWLLLGLSSIFLCITLGATVFKKLKLLGAIGIYYAGSFVLQLVLQIFGTFASLFLMEGLIVAYANASTGQGVALTSLLILIAAAMVAALGFFFYFTMLDIVERKLNLP